MKHLKKAAVAVVGGGVIGASVAYHLAINGVRNVVVLDRGSMPGAGSTSRATGGFRAQFGTAINVRLSIASREMLLRFPDDIGADPILARRIPLARIQRRSARLAARCAAIAARRGSP